MKNLKEIQLLLCFIGLPFMIGAAFHFGDWWLGLPALVVFGIFWIGIVTVINKTDWTD
jgi:fatty acid desaturase